MTTQPSAIRLERFLAESNAIEGITRRPTSLEIEATAEFLQSPTITTADLDSLVSIYEPGAKLRRGHRMNVRVGRYTAPPGGTRIRVALLIILRDICAGATSPFDAHIAYEKLHPFTDGNGRSGRALWAWQMCRLDHPWERDRLSFLHRFYYQTLDAVSR